MQKKILNKQITMLMLIAGMVILLSSACSFQNQGHGSDKLRLGYLLNMTHIVPIVGLEDKLFDNVEGSYFLSGGYLINSLITGNLDLAYVGPGPFINSINKEIKVMALAASAKGANSLVLSHEFVESVSKPHSTRKLIRKIRKLGVPQYGNTQDLLAKELFDGLFPEAHQMQYIAVNPAEMETAFYTRAIDAALVTEPWGTMLESKGAEIISLDEVITELKHGSNPNLEALTKQKGFDQLIIKKLTKLNEYPAAMLIAYKPFYIRNKELINSFIAEQNKVLESIKQNPQHALSSAQKHFKKVMQRDIEMDFLNTSFSKVKLADNDKDLSIDVLKDMMEISHHAKYIQEPRIKRLERNTKLIRE